MADQISRETIQDSVYQGSGRRTHGSVLSNRADGAEAELNGESRRSRIAPGKENVDVFGSYHHPNLPWGSPSPLPEGYPRIPLQDITAILSPVNGESERKREDTTHRGPPRKKLKKRKKKQVSIETATISRTNASTEAKSEGKQECFTLESISNVVKPATIDPSSKVILLQPTEQWATYGGQHSAQALATPHFPNAGLPVGKESIHAKESEQQQQQQQQQYKKLTPGKETRASSTATRSSLMKFR